MPTGGSGEIDKTKRGGEKCGRHDLHRGSLKTPLLRAVVEPRVDDATNYCHGFHVLMMQTFGELSNYRYLRFTRMGPPSTVYVTSSADSGTSISPLTM